MKTIVITGSTRGIGYGLAEAFLERGCQVVISGRKPETVEAAARKLAEKYLAGQVLGQPCDVSDYAQVVGLWDAAVANFGKVDIWINNAGQANTLTPFWDLTPEKMQSVVRSNMLGTMYGSKAALLGMFQQGYGALFNMEGFGSSGSRLQPGLTLYGTTKAALAFLDRSLAAELEKWSGSKPVTVGAILPGMVVTDLLLDQRTGNPEDWERSKKVFNILADRVETVTPWIADQVLAGQPNGKRLSWTSGGKIMLRFLMAPFRKRNVID